MRDPRFNSLASAVCIALIFVHPYIEGRLNQDLLTIFFIVPVVGLPFIGAIYFGLRTLVFGSPQAFGHWRHLASLWISVGIAVLLFLLAWQVIGRVHNPLFLSGFRHRILSQITPDQLRAVADQIQRLGEANEKIPGYRRPVLSSPGRRHSYGAAAQAEAENWQQMLALPGFAHLDEYRLFECRPDYVDIWWGPALSFSRGVRIQKNTDIRPPERRSFAPIAPDIVVFVGTH